MAKRPNLGQITSSVFTVSQLNTAYDKIDTAFDNTLSRDGSTPNTMLADLDMNSNDIINVGTMYGDAIDVTEAYIGGKLFTGTLTWRSDWLTGTSYQLLDLVKENGIVYVALEEHTSGVFATDLAAGKWEIFVEATGGGGGGGGVTDHGALTGLSDDDHTQYHNDTRGDARYYTKSQVDTSLSGKANTSHTHTVADVTGLESRLDVGSTRISDDFVGENKVGLLSDLKVTAAASTRFAGAYRSRDIGAINWYFAAQAMTLAPEAFPQADRQTFCQVAIDRGVVGPRQNTSAYTASTMVTFPSGKVYFCNIPGTTAGAAPSDAAIVTAGSFLGDGTVTWEYTGLQVPSSWAWFMVDIGSNLLTVQAPDSTDSYPAMLASAAELAGVDAAWLNTASAHPGETRMDVINNLIQNGMTDDLTGTSPGARLSYTFQDQLTPAGAAYTVRFLADNVEVWRGYIAQAALLTIVGSSATAALQNAADVKTGILSTQLFDSGRFKAYVGRPNYDTITGDSVYPTDFRFHLFPYLYGMLDGVTETQDYADDVYNYIKANVPGLFSASLDTFPLAESFYAMIKMGIETAKDTMYWRITSRNVGNIVITDAAIMSSLLGYRYLDNTATDAQLRDRSTHTGTQLAATISDFATAVAATAAVTANTAKVTNANHTGDATGSTALTLATVNSNVGSFGSATQIPTFTVNGKGLTTAAANVAIAIPSTQVTDFAEAVDDRVSSLLVAGSNITLTYNDAGNTLTIASSGGGGGFDYGLNAAMSGLMPY